MPAHPTFYCRRAVYSRYGLFDLDFKVAADFEQLLRLIFVNEIYTKYIPLDFVTMRTGGASSSGFQAVKSALMRGVVYILPNNVRALIYSKLLRS